MTGETQSADPFSARLALHAGGVLGEFNRAGVLVPADVHVAERLAALGDDPDETVALAVALAVRGPRFGHVYVDLSTVRATATTDLDAGAGADVDIASLPWPDPGRWIRTLAASPLVSAGEDAEQGRPLRLVGAALYLDRYWRDERAVAADLLARGREEGPASPAPAPTSQVPIDYAALGDGLRRLFPGSPGEEGSGDRDGRGCGEQRWAAAAAVLRRLAVIAGGPGTGKTTTVARMLALFQEQAAATGMRTPLIGLAAPTGKAAARLEEAVHAEALRMELGDEVRRRLMSLGSSTIHRLLGRRPQSASRFRHDRHNRLPHDLLVIDETSMVPLSLMARLVEAVRPDAHLVLVGDPDQLASVEAGAVLGDIVGPAIEGMRMSAQAADRLRRVTGSALPTTPPPGGAGIGDGVVILRSNHRFRGALADLAAAIRAGDADEAVAVLSGGDPAVSWLQVEDLTDPAARGTPQLRPLRQAVVAAGKAMLEAATAGDRAAALAALRGFRVLCAHRRGGAGVGEWNQMAEEWLALSVEGFNPEREWYPGRPVMVTANDYGLRLFNGDTGVVVSTGTGAEVAFERAASAVAVSPARLADVETVFAMTVHKSQGSEFREAAVVLPPATSPVLTRELLYTAVTRAQQSVIVAGSEESVRAGVARPVARASGLTRRLWETGGAPSAGVVAGEAGVPLA